MIKTKQELHNYIKAFALKSSKEVFKEMGETPEQLLVGSHITMLITLFFAQLSLELEEQVFGDINNA